MITGPRKKFVKEKSFADIFTEKWRARVLASAAPCAPVGWRGFMLANGALWFNRSDNRWRIFSVNGARQEKLEDANLPIGWKASGGLIPPQCFVRIWSSGDNFEEFEEQFAIKDPGDFRHNPGKYLGAEISRLAPLTPSWGGEKLVLAAPVDRCLDGSVQGGVIGAPRALNVRVSERSVESKTCTSDTSCRNYAYTVLARVSRKHCESLAPNLKGTCQAAFLVAAADYAGGSMGWDHGYNIYGLFTLENGQKLIVPLKNFNKKNDAINYIETSAQ